MINAKGERELAYIVKVTDVLPMDADRLENVKINGWSVVAGKGEFKKDDLGIFFEIDSKLPEVKPFTDMEFLVSKHYKIKTQKIRGVYSQGLLIPPSALGWEIQADGSLWNPAAGDHGRYEEGAGLTEELGVTYSIPEDNKRKKTDQNAKYSRMSQRHKELFKKPLFRWLMRRQWGRELLFFFFGKKTDKPLQFPTHFEFVHKTDEERVENIPYILESTEPWIKTCKVDGTSSTYILERKGKNKYEFYVTSRNVRQRTPDQKNYHNDVSKGEVETNVYWDMAFKYHIEEFLKVQLELNPTWKYVCLQGETAGPALQGNPHKLKEVQFFGFNFIDSEQGRWNSVDAKELCEKYDIPWVPIIDTNYILPKDMEEMKLSADGPCDIPGSSGLREGFVYRSLDGKKSFKNVSRNYLLKKGE